MKIEVDVKFNIGDKVLVKDTSGNAHYYNKGELPIKATITGFVITKDTKRTTVYYFIEPLLGEVDRIRGYDLANATSHRRRYNAKWLERIEE